MMSYELLKVIHIICSTILFGTGIGSAFYMFMANRRGDLAGIVFATRHVVIADWAFTTPAVIIQFLSGYLLARELGYDFSERWLQIAIALYFFAGACWLPVVWIQIKMRDMASEAIQENKKLPARYWHLDKWWLILGALAFPAILIVFYLMVVKP